jgi:hypothetical protein
VIQHNGRAAVVVPLLLMVAAVAIAIWQNMIALAFVAVAVFVQFFTQLWAGTRVEKKVETIEVRIVHIETDVEKIKAREVGRYGSPEAFG